MSMVGPLQAEPVPSVAKENFSHTNLKQKKSQIFKLRNAEYRDIQIKWNLWCICIPEEVNLLEQQLFSQSRKHRPVTIRRRRSSIRCWKN